LEHVGFGCQGEPVVVHLFHKLHAALVRSAIVTAGRAIPYLVDEHGLFADVTLRQRPTKVVVKDVNHGVKELGYKQWRCCRSQLA
jgi:hypothetical protein